MAIDLVVGTLSIKSDKNLHSAILSGEEPGWKRIEIACKLIDFALGVKEFQVRQQQPELDPFEVRRRAIAAFASN